MRVGTHGLKSGSRSTLWAPLSQHRGTARSSDGNHRGAIFRGLVGIALSLRILSSWPPLRQLAPLTGYRPKPSHYSLSIWSQHPICRCVLDGALLLPPHYQAEGTHLNDDGLEAVIFHLKAIVITNLGADSLGNSLGQCPGPMPWRLSIRLLRPS